MQRSDIKPRPDGRVLDAVSLHLKISGFLTRPAAEATQIYCFGFLYIRFFGMLTIEASGAGQGKCLWLAVAVSARRFRSRRPDVHCWRVRRPEH
jgi:hypothetical protein